MRKYEIMYIIRPNIEEEAKKALVERFSRIFNMTMVRKSVETKEWGKRRLSIRNQRFT